MKSETIFYTLKHSYSLLYPIFKSIGLSSFSVYLGVTAQTSFYEVTRGKPASEYYEQEPEEETELDVFNSAFIDYDPNVTDYGEDDTQETYTQYRTPSGHIVCACT